MTTQQLIQTAPDTTSAQPLKTGLNYLSKLECRLVDYIKLNKKYRQDTCRTHISIYCLPT